jgi:DNA-binding NtrC family response regulator
MENKPDGIRVLVVDDEKDIRDASERILTKMGFEVVKASRGDEAIQILPEKQVSIVLLDLKMPGLDGIEVLKRIQVMDKDILVIVITGYATVETAIEAMKLGAYDFIPKPFEPDHLRIVVNRAQEKLRLAWEAERL